ncbi:MAG: SDR family NAD(P)-dependent oxidoreductase [Ignavibacteriales bacterium]|jgi:short-subunit dehydrogenase|nr:SDR family NAD(P)-dependent oxidoreductase [Melioribacteraceae bacterium]RJP57040.1 MAG: SDR family NAD(P)-dependent oxidoreductase [Ignavibacteriales bacterium]
MAQSNSAVWITGASSGIGKSIALEFASQGNVVAASSRNNEALKRLKKEVSDKSTIETYPLDVKDPNQVLETVEKITQNYNIDCLINNAGSTTFKLAVDNSLSEIDEIIKTNLNGAIYAIKSVLPKMLEKKEGMIINIISVAAEKVLTKSSVYAASKAGLQTYTKVLREELRNSNIKIINILPGATRTPIWPNNVLEKHSERMMSPSELAKFIYHIYSIKSNLVPEEVTIRPIKGDL